MSTRGLFIAGTDTGVGKTYVTATLARELRRDRSVGVYKPVATGASLDEAGRHRWDDIETLNASVDGAFERERICPQCFRAPLAPPAAARAEHRTVDNRLLREGARWWIGRVDVLLIEGVGGLLCPLDAQRTVGDFAAELGFPILIVARQALGTINHTLLTLEAARARGLAVAGVVLNEVTPATGDLSVATNAQEIEARGHVPVLATVPHGEPAGLLRDRRGHTIDWIELCGVVDGD